MRTYKTKAKLQQGEMAFSTAVGFDSPCTWETGHTGPKPHTVPHYTVESHPQI